MAHEYTFLGLLSLESGSWADWFSGTMSALAVITALAAYPIANRQQQKAQRKRDGEIARAVGWKLLGVLNSTGDISRHLNTSLAKREPTFPAGLKFPLVRPLGIPDRHPRELNQTETDFLLKAQAPDLLAEIDMSMGRYESILFGMKEYKARHEALFELMPRPVSSDGATFTHKLTPEESERVGPYAQMLETLLEGMIAMTEENMAKTLAALDQYERDMTRFFGKSPLGFEIDQKVAALG